MPCGLERVDSGRQSGDEQGKYALFLRFSVYSLNIHTHIHTHTSTGIKSSPLNRKSRWISALIGCVQGKTIRVNYTSSQLGQKNQLRRGQHRVCVEVERQCGGNFGRKRVQNGLIP